MWYISTMLSNLGLSLAPQCCPVPDYPISYVLIGSNLLRFHHNVVRSQTTQFDTCWLLQHKFFWCHVLGTHVMVRIFPAYRFTLISIPTFLCFNLSLRTSCRSRHLNHHASQPICYRCLRVSSLLLSGT